MAYIEIKRIAGKLYRYERVSYRVGKRVRHTSRYLGPVERVYKRRRGGRKPKLRARALSGQETDRLRDLLKSSRSFEKDRARILLLSNEGKTVREICEKTRFYKPRVLGIIKAFNERGFDIFKRRKSPGRPRRITKEQRASIIQFVNTDPRKLGLHFTTWSLVRLASHAQERGIKVSPSQVRRIIKSDNVGYKKKHRWLYSNDPEFFKKNSL